MGGPWTRLNQYFSQSISGPFFERFLRGFGIRNGLGNGSKIGLKINSVPTNHIQKKILELGGINYAIINNKHKLSKIVEEILIRKIKAAGQSCSSINKIFVDNI